MNACDVINAVLDENFEEGDELDSACLSRLKDLAEMHEDHEVTNHTVSLLLHVERLLDLEPDLIGLRCNGRKGE